jgi:signal transduction histidine kinase
MKTWSRADLVGLFLAVFGIISFIFSNSAWLTSVSLLIAVVALLYNIYDTKYDSAKYLDILCHYQAILSSSFDGWIAWNDNDEYIASSQKLRTFFEIKRNTDISLEDILSVIDSEDAENLSLYFNRLKKMGINFQLTVKITSNGEQIEIHGFKMIINNTETVLLWCSNITESSSLVDSAERKSASFQEELDSLLEILDRLPLPIWKRNKMLEITYCNKTYADYVDADIEKILQNNIPLVLGNLFGQGHSLAENAKKCNRLQNISQFVMVNGTRKKVSVYECPVSNENFIGYATDITSEEALAINLDRVITANYEVLEALSTAIVIFGENTRVIFFNSAYQSLMKLESGWLHSKPTYGEVLDELRNNRLLSEQADYQAFKKSQLELFTSITAPTQELTHLPNGKTLRLMISPHPLGGLFFVYEDVTDSLALQRKNNTLLAVQKETINNLYEGIMVYGSNNRLKIINNAIYKIWELGDEEAVSNLKGMHISEILDLIKDELDYGANWEEFKENTISNLTDRIVKDGKLIKKNGSVIMFSYVPLPDGAHMHSFIDITDSYMVEDAIMEKNQALKTAQDLRFEFVSGISVELKEPLNILIGFAELLLHQYFGALSEKQLEYCQYILMASNQLHQLINNLLEMVSIDIDSKDLDFSLFPMKDTVDEVISSLEKRINEKSISVIKIYPPEDIKFNGDKIRIKQSVYNILTNAIKSAPFHGRIEVVISKNDEYLKIIVKNDGGEFSNGNDKNLLRKRSTKTAKFLNKAEKDNGISMPLVKSLIELHGGTLNISSDIEEGICIVCTLPMTISEGLPTNNYSDDGIAFQEAINS